MMNVNLPTRRARSGAASLLAVQNGVFCFTTVVAATVPFAVNFDLWG
ncbi:MAG: hypothetical protein O3B05_06880 [archaeon]|nr:hypothetical protein [archaeon]